MCMTPKSPNSNDLWTLPVRSDRVFTLKISRNIALTLLVSILVHLSLLWIFAPKLLTFDAPVAKAPPLEITLGPPQEQQTAPREIVLPPPEVMQQQKPVEITKPNKKTQTPKQHVAVPPVKLVEQSDSKVQKLNKKRPTPEPPAVSRSPLPGEDMQAYIKRQQQAKLAKQGLSEQEVEQVMADSNPLSEGEKRDAKIKENLELDGNNGIFQIRHLARETAQFSFKGWRNNINTARLEVFDVSAFNGQDIRKVVIKKMIEIIRREYQGDFNWESRRLGRVIALSARIEDTEALEGFMMQEFFGAGTPYRN